MHKPPTKKLTFQRQTLRTLTDLTAVTGGAQSHHVTCASATCRSGDPLCVDPISKRR